jgi:hypothetical protein
VTEQYARLMTEAFDPFPLKITWEQLDEGT